MLGNTYINKSKIIFLCLFLCLVPNIIRTEILAEGVKIITSNEKELVIEFQPQFINFSEIITSDGTNAVIPNIKGAQSASEKSGEPNEAYYMQNISVPNSSGFKLSNVEISEISLFNKFLAPVPTLVNENGIPTEKYVVNTDIYNQPTHQWVELQYAGIGRDRYIAKLKVLAARWNSQIQSIEIPKKIRVTIAFDDVSQKNQIFSKNDLPIGINYYNTPNFRILDQQRYSEKKSYNQLQEVANNWVKIEIPKEGIYKIDAGLLSSLGINLSKDEIPTIKIYGNGGKDISEQVSDAQQNLMKEQDIIVRTKQDGTLDAIIFYGASTKGFEVRFDEIHRYINHYSNNNYYMLTWGGDPGKRAVAQEPENLEVVNRPQTYYHRITFEEEINAPYTPPAGRTWFGRTLFSSSSPLSYIDLLPNLDRTQDILFRFSLAHRSTTNGFFTIYQNNDPISDFLISGSSIDNYHPASRIFATAIYPASKISSDDRSALKFEYKNPNSPTSAIGFLDYYEIHYPRSFYAINNELSFYADTSLSGMTEFSINGFNNDLLGFDLTDIRQPKLLKNLSNTGGIFVFRKNLVKDSLNRFFISGILDIPKIEKVVLANLKSQYQGEDVIMITDKTLLKSAQKYKEYRESHSDLKVFIATTEDIYNEFDAGLPDITAIRDFISYAFHNSINKPKYVILWGDGHFDFKNIQYKQVNFVPAYQVSDEYITDFDEINQSWTTDDFYCRVEGNDLIIDLAVGRMTIRSDAQGMDIIDKIDHYENASSEDDWRTHIIMLADDGPSGDSYGGGLPFEYQPWYIPDSEDIFRDNLPPFMIADKIYLAEYPTENISGARRKPEATQQMLSKINTSGGVLMNWIGHGNPQVLAHEHLFDRDINIVQMSNWDKLFFFVAATCDFGRFDDPGVSSGAEDLFLSTTGGSIGVFSASRVVYAQDNALLSQRTYKELFTRSQITGFYRMLGDIIYSVKQSFWDTNSQKYFLLGDPTLTLNLPNYIAQIDSINDVQITDSIDVLHLKGLSKVKISGSIRNPNTNEIDPSFAGTAYTTLNDGDYIKLSYDDIVPNSAEYKIQEYGGALNRSSAIVENGKFSMEFILPKDISFSDSAGRIFAFAVSNDNRYAMGSNRKFVIDGIIAGNINDTVPPLIKLYLDTRNFKSGDIVSQNPLLIIDLYDDSGINTTGLGIGHNLEAWIDDSPASISLVKNMKLNYYLKNSATVEQILYNLTEGKHKIKVRAWDVLNNYAVDSTEFVIPKENSFTISKVIIIPNPFNLSGTKIAFYHNIEPPINIDINIYNELGMFVRSISTTSSAYGYSEVQWDGKDMLGNEISIGTYYFVIKATSSSEISTVSKSGIGIFIK
ncbi:MAG TPA: type IX secretion system sortase PorU [Candidatus Kapabacteria bacterium]|nr:type IX secretion system sortase PorU [Candidatus Kapabacteria bacterium]